MTKSLPLDRVTLCAIDTRTPELAAQAMNRSMQGLQFAEGLLFTHGSFANNNPGVRVVDIPVLTSAEEYSAFVLTQLVHHIKTDFVLIVQWDGFVLNPSAWRPDFLDWDYIGAPWSKGPLNRRVGNGGFSLRSRRLLLAMQDTSMVPRHPEDVCLAHTHRERLERLHGIRFAPVDLAHHFAFESTSPAVKTFGFHGMNHLPSVLDEASCESALAALPDKALAGRDGYKTIRTLIRAGRWQHASRLLDRRRKVTSPNAKVWLLTLRCALKKWMSA